mmetsp:Transcript_30430/g.97277  ORF Transcript_30430/g.97277 Transcript_30430/m.97277 type:complete len:179 (-) Transcript_30430:251-787(-)
MVDPWHGEALLEELGTAAVGDPPGDNDTTGPPDAQAGTRRRFGVLQAGAGAAAQAAAASTEAPATAIFASGRLGGSMGTALRRQSRQRSASCAPVLQQAGRSAQPSEEAAGGSASSGSATGAASAPPAAATPLRAPAAPGSVAAADGAGPAMVPRRPDAPPPPQRGGMRGRRGMQHAR